MLRVNHYYSYNIAPTRAASEFSHSLQEKRTTRAVRFRSKPPFDSGDMNSASCPTADLAGGTDSRPSWGKRHSRFT